ncbi:hypothetical protein DMC01_12545, partial [Campylobacter troglodytis]
MNFIVSMHEDKKSIYIIVYSNNVFINCDEIYEELFAYFKDDKKCLNLAELKSYTVRLFLHSTLLKGSKQVPSFSTLTQNTSNSPLFFSEVDKEGNFKANSPFYHFIPADETLN